jgi:hypothetical protein
LFAFVSNAALSVHLPPKTNDSGDYIYCTGVLPKDLVVHCATPWFKAGQDGRYVLNDPKTLMSPAANLPPVRSGGRHAYDGFIDTVRWGV